MTSEDVAGSLIAALGQGGEYVDEGGFTLDAAKAQAKLRSYQLNDPHGYLLLLVEATWLATRDRGPNRRARIEIDTGPTTTVVFDGPSFTAHALGNLFGAALGDATGVEGDPLRARVLQLIGLAANSALAFEPRGLSVDAVDPQGQRLRAQISADEVTVELVEGSDPAPIPELRLVLQGNRLDLDRPRRERELVRERCRGSSLEIRVDKQRVSKGLAADFDAEGVRAPVLLAAQEIGVLGYTPDFGLAKARIINRGVEVEVLHVSGPAGLLAVVEVDLPLDLSRSQIQRGKAFDALEQALQSAIEQLPKVHGRVNWKAVQTGDGWMFFIISLLLLGAIALFGLLIMAALMLAEGG